MKMDIKYDEGTFCDLMKLPSVRGHPSIKSFSVSQDEYAQLREWINQRKLQIRIPSHQPKNAFEILFVVRHSFDSKWKTLSYFEHLLFEYHKERWGLFFDRLVGYMERKWPSKRIEYMSEPVIMTWTSILTLVLVIVFLCGIIGVYAHFYNPSVLHVQKPLNSWFHAVLIWLWLPLFYSWIKSLRNQEM